MYRRIKFAKDICLVVCFHALVGGAVAQEWPAVTEPGFYPCGKPAKKGCIENLSREETVEGRKEYVGLLKSNKAFTNAVGAYACKSRAAYESHSPIRRFYSNSTEDAGDCFNLARGNIVTLKECSPDFSVCRFSAGSSEADFWTEIYNVSPTR